MLRRIRTLDIERCIALVLVVFAAIELYGALKLSVSEEFTLGPGALPIIYAVGLIIFAGILLVWPAKKAPSIIENPVEREAEVAKENEIVPVRDYRAGALTFGFIAVLIISIYFIGFFGGTVIFAFLFTRFITRWPLLKSAVFALIWGAALYCVFDRLLEVQLEPGILFGG